jgi:hypothetical protein
VSAEAKAIGISPATLTRFIEGGKPNAPVWAKLVAY